LGTPQFIFVAVFVTATCNGAHPALLLTVKLAVGIGLTQIRLMIKSGPQPGSELAPTANFIS
jgi:hypothetical protein